MFKHKTEEALALLEEVKTNARLRITKLKLDAVVHVSALAADLITNTFTLLCGVLAFLFATLTLGFWISELTGSDAIGFGGLTAFYILFAIGMGLIKDRFIEKALINFTIRKYFKKYTRAHEDQE